MSRENVEIVGSVFEAWNDGSLEDVLPFAAEGIEWVEVEGLPGIEGGDFRGKARVRSMLESLLDTWEHYRLEPEDVRAVGDDRVIAVLREVGRGRLSGAPAESRWGYVVTVRDGKVSRVEAYRNPQDALEAVGLSE
jgi:ketosteroid isomerase-like protein